MQDMFSARICPYIYGVRLPADTMEIFAENLRRLRLGRKLTQQAAAEKGSFSYNHYQALETARLDGFTFSTIERLAGLFEVEVWKMFHPTAIAKPKIEKIARGKMRRRAR